MTYEALRRAAMETKEALKNLRTQHSLTQDELAEKLFITRQAVSRWENGKTTPNIETLKLMSKEFNTPINTLLGNTQDPVCQSCSMPLIEADDFGTNKDEGINIEYCSHCYQGGGYTHDRTMEEMVETNLHFLDEFNAQHGSNYSEDEARAILSLHLATLKRWKNN